MNLKDEKDRKSLLSVVLLTLAVTLMGFTVFELAQIARADNDINALTDEDFKQIRPDAEKTREYLDAYQKAATSLTEHNMFVPPQDETEPEADCTAIFGDEARIDNRWVKIGDRVGGAEVVALGPTVVTLLWQDREIRRSPVLREEGRSNNRSSNQRTQSTRFDRGQMEDMRSRMRGGRGADMMMGGRGGNMGGGRGGNMGGGRGGGGRGGRGGGRGGRE